MIISRKWYTNAHKRNLQRLPFDCNNVRQAWKGLLHEGSISNKQKQPRSKSNPACLEKRSIDGHRTIMDDVREHIDIYQRNNSQAQ